MSALRTTWCSHLREYQEMQLIKVKLSRIQFEKKLAKWYVDTLKLKK